METEYRVYRGGWDVGISFSSVESAKAWIRAGDTCSYEIYKVTRTEELVESC